MDARPRALDITMSADASLNKKMVVLLDAGATIDGNFRLGDASIFHFIMVPIQIYHLCSYMHAKARWPTKTTLWGLDIAPAVCPVLIAMALFYSICCNTFFSLAAICYATATNYA